MSDKEKFITAFKNRTKKFSADVIFFVESLKKTKSANVITYQLVKSATSIAANYRAVCRARSKAEFYAKVCIVVEEADESLFWLELIKDTKLSTELTELNRLLDESEQILKVVAKAKNARFDKK